MRFEPEDTAGSRGGEGARRPGDVGFAPTEAERRSNPPLATKEGAVARRPAIMPWRPGVVHKRF